VESSDLLINTVSFSVSSKLVKKKFFLLDHTAITPNSIPKLDAIHSNGILKHDPGEYHGGTYKKAFRVHYYDNPHKDLKTMFTLLFDMASF